MSRLTFSLLTRLAHIGRGLKVQQLADHVGEALLVVKRRLNVLRDQGWTEVRSGIWTLTETGRIAAEAETSRRAEALYVRGWQALRIIKTANINELVTLAARPDEPRALSTLTSYFRNLVRANLVIQVANSSPVRYGLLHDPGPNAPQVRLSKRLVYEPNSNRHIPLGVEDEHAA